MDYLSVFATFARLGGVLIAIYVLRFLPIYIRGINSATMPYALFDIGILAFCVIVIIPLVCVPRAVASAIFAGPISALQSKAVAARPERIRHAAFSVLGLWLVVQGLLDATYSVVFRIYEREYLGHNRDAMLTPENVADRAVIVVTLILGVSLLFGSSGLIGLIRRARAWSR